MIESTAVPKTINEYIANFPTDIQNVLEQVRATIKQAAPAASEAISYAMPTFRWKGNLVHFAAFKNHIGFFATPTGNDAFKNELAAYKTGKGSIQLPLDQPMPLDLITRIVAFRVNQNAEKWESTKKKSSI